MSLYFKKKNEKKVIMLVLYNKSDAEKKITINKKEALMLELKLNKSEYGKNWRNIGDLLYDFSIGKNIQEIELNSFQFEFFSILLCS